MARFTSAAWTDKTMRATPEARRTLMQELARGDHEIIDGNGQPIDLSPPPTHVDVAPPPPFPVRDAYGRIIVEAAPEHKSETPPRPMSFNLEDRGSFDRYFANETEEVRASARLQYDRLRKEHGID